MLAPWVVDEMRNADLNDKRLDERLGEVLSQLAARPTASIPAACGGRAEMEAAYRLFDNPKVTFENILQSHREATGRRLAAERVALLVQDTTEIDLTRPEQQVRGAGPLDHGSRRGALLHLLHAFTPDGTPLGTLHAQTWTRAEDKPPTASLTRAQRAATPIEEKESHRWLTTFQQACAHAAACPDTQLVCVADSEADIYELLAAAAAQQVAGVQWLIRAGCDRALQAEAEPADAPAAVAAEDEAVAPASVRAQVLATDVLFTQNISVRGRKAKVACETRGRRQPRESRAAEVEVRAAQVMLRPPWRPDRQLPVVTVNVVLAREIAPPDNEQPVEWLLLTSLPIEEVGQVRQVVEHYCVRWQVEVFFRTLKSGCRAEERRFEQLDRQLRCLAVYLIVAWRTLYVCRLGRQCPEMSCDAVFEPAEWKAVCRVAQNKPPPRKPPPLGEMVRLIAQLGGYVNRPRAAPPGPQTVWLGLQRMHDFARCWELFGPETRNTT